MRLENRVAIITGGGNGIGKAISQRFALEGAKLTIADLEQDAAKQVASEITETGGNAFAHHTDTSNDQSVREAIQATLTRYGRIDILVNNAAAFVFGNVEQVSKSDWDKVFSVNVIGYANMVRECLPEFRSNGNGVVVNIASVSSFIAQPEFIPYNASKGAVLQLTRCLAMDLAPDNVRVNAICPGAIRTRATDRHIASLGLEPEAAYKDFGKDSLMNRMGKPEEIASGVLFLASDDASFVTGSHVVIDGGATID